MATAACRQCLLAQSSRGRPAHRPGCQDWGTAADERFSRDYRPLALSAVRAGPRVRVASDSLRSVLVRVRGRPRRRHAGDSRTSPALLIAGPSNRATVRQLAALGTAVRSAARFEVYYARTSAQRPSARRLRLLLCAERASVAPALSPVCTRTVCCDRRRAPRQEETQREAARAVCSTRGRGR